MSRPRTVPVHALAAGAMALLIASLGSPAAAQDRPSLSALPPEVNSLVMRLGEPQISFMAPLVARTPQAWKPEQLQAFRERLAKAVLAHPEVLAVSAARGAAQFGIREAQAARLPQVSSQLDNGQKYSSANSLLGTPERDYRTAGLSVTVRQLLYDFGATPRNIEAMSAKERQAFFRQMQVRDEVALRAVQAYHDLVRARTQLELARRNEEARTSIVDLVRQRSDIGGGTQSDVVRAQSRLADATATTASAMQRLGVARAAYRELFSTDADLPADAPVFDIPLDSGIASQQPQIVEDTWKVRQALAGRAAVEAEMAAVRGRSLPSINLELSATRRDLVGPANPGTDRSVMLVAKQSLYAGGADSARIDAASQKLLQSSEELESARRESARVLDQVLLEAESQERLMESRANTARLAAESLKMVREQYAYRRGTLLDLLTAQESLYAAGRELIDSQLDQAMSRYRVLNAASRLSQFVGTEGRAPTP